MTLPCSPPSSLTKLVLRAVGVLVLVDQHVPEALAVLLAARLVLARASAPAARAGRRRSPRSPAAAPARARGRPARRPSRTDPSPAPAYSPAVTSAFFASEIARGSPAASSASARCEPLHDALDDAERVVLVVDREARRAPDEVRARAQHPRADRVERAAPHPRRLARRAAGRCARASRRRPCS